MIDDLILKTRKLWTWLLLQVDLALLPRQDRQELRAKMKATKRERHNH